MGEGRQPGAEAVMHWVDEVDAAADDARASGVRDRAIAACAMLASIAVPSELLPGKKERALLVRIGKDTENARGMGSIAVRSVPPPSDCGARLAWLAACRPNKKS